MTETRGGWDAAVIGAGVNGLTAAAYLARAGKRVLVLEKRPVAGGSAVTEEIFPGFKVSTVTHRAYVPGAIVRELGLETHGLEIYRPDALLTAPLAGGGGLTLWRDPEKTRAALSRHSPRDAERYTAFDALVRDLAGFLAPLVSAPAIVPDGGAADLFSFLKLGLKFRSLGARTMHEALRVLPMASADWLNEWFETDALKAMLASRGVAGTFVAPRSPGTAALFLLHEVGRSEAGFPRGGMGALSSVLETAARGFGAEIRTSVPVRRVTLENGRAAGVVLENGQEISARVVLSNADPRSTLTRLVDPGALPPELLSRVLHIRFRGAVAKVNLALDALPEFRGVPPEELSGAVHIGPTLDGMERAFDEAKYGRFSTRPVLEVVIPSLFDPTLAPSGKHVASILAQFVPYRLRDGGPEARSALGDAVVETLAEYAPGIQNAILHREVLTPWDLEEKFGLPEGNLLHGEQTLDQLFFMRPMPGWARYSTPIPGLYLCGAGTHPGGSVTGGSGRNAAHQVARDLTRGA